MNIQPILEEIEQALKEVKITQPMTVAIMGCVVNGPGEADGADVAICAGKGKAILYSRGERLGGVLPEEITAAVMKEVRRLIDLS